eukprot:jgi/Ulvmu1/10736/UM068_0024.1
MLGSLLIAAALAAYVAATVVFSFYKAEREVHPGADEDENEALPVESLALAIAGCVAGVTGALIVAGRLRECRVQVSTSMDINSYSKSYHSFNTRAQFLQPQVTGFSS